MGFKSIIILLILIWHVSAKQITRIDPPNWWVGMQHDTLELMLYGKDFSGIHVHAQSSELSIIDVHVPSNPIYAFVTIKLDKDASAGVYSFEVSSRAFDSEIIDYPFKRRIENTMRYRGFDCSDIVYLITPDRFVNGNTANDTSPEMVAEFSSDPANLLRRAGGDIAGILEKLNYLKELGITAIWINPLTENNMPISYHGYAVTDFYRIDPRFGTNSEYVELVSQAHELDIKVIMDHVVNHVGINHPWIEQLPDPSWINGSIDEHELNHHKKKVIFDPYADSLQTQNVTDAWFDDIMPDLNQKNRHLANYLIQNSLWWIETAGIDGIREDTYPYADREFLARWARSIFTEYPDFNIVGEVWVHDPVFIAPFQSQSPVADGFDTHLPSVTDFGLFEAFGRVFNRNQDISAFYHFLSEDFLYAEPNQLLTFVDNHDVMRLNELVAGDSLRYVMALKMLLTLRGIPQIYYGTEIGITGGEGHENIRRQFPGGFADQDRNAFKRHDRTARENYVYDYVQRLIHLRKKHPALNCGNMIHFEPKNNVYMYLREAQDEKILMIANNRNEEYMIAPKEALHYITDYEKLRNLETGALFSISADMTITIPAYDVAILLAE